MLNIHAVGAQTSGVSNECNKRYRSTTREALTRNKNEKFVIFQILIKISFLTECRWLLWVRVHCTSIRDVADRFRGAPIDSVCCCSHFLQFVACDQAATLTKFEHVYCFQFLLDAFRVFSRSIFVLSRLPAPLPGWSECEWNVCAFRCNDNDNWSGLWRRDFHICLIAIEIDVPHNMHVVSRARDPQLDRFARTLVDDDNA